MKMAGRFSSDFPQIQRTRFAESQDAAKISEELKEDVARHVTPPITIATDVGSHRRQQIVIVTVPTGHEKPYAVAPGNIYVRQEGDTTLAMRDEIVDLVKSGLESEQSVLPLLGGEAAKWRAGASSSRASNPAATECRARARGIITRSPRKTIEDAADSAPPHRR